MLGWWSKSTAPTAAESRSDPARDAWFAANGFRVLRLWNHEVLGTPQVALDAIFAALTERTVRSAKTPSSAPSGHLVPRGEKVERAVSPRGASGADLGCGIDEGADASPSASSLLPLREKVAAKRPDEGARAAQRRTIPEENRGDR